jgi:lysophospholipase L1-like esterase
VQKAAARGIDQTAINDWEQRVRDWLDSLPKEHKDFALRNKFPWNELTYGLSRPAYWALGIDLDTPGADRKWNAMASVLKEIVAGVRARGKEIALIYIPSKWQYNPGSHSPTSLTRVSGIIVKESWLEGELEIDHRLADLTEDIQVPFLNLTKSLRNEVATGAVLDWQYDSHFTPGGYRFVAESVADWISDEHVFRGLKSPLPRETLKRNRH